MRHCGKKKNDLNDESKHILGHTDIWVNIEFDPVVCWNKKTPPGAFCVLSLSDNKILIVRNILTAKYTKLPIFTAQRTLNVFAKCF